MSRAPAKPPGDRRQAVCAWLQANGINPSDATEPTLRAPADMESWRP